MKRFLFITDTHFRDTAPKSRVDNIMKTQFEELGDIVQIVHEYGVDAILHGGDFFDTKKPSHQLVAEIIEWCKVVAVPIFVTIGNHDVTGYNLDSVRNSGLGVLFESGAVSVLNDEVYEEEKIVIRGIHTALNFEQNYNLESKYDGYVKILTSHNYVIPTDEMPFGFIHPKDIPTNADLVLCGHYHVPFDYTGQNTRWINPGATSRWSIDQKDRVPTALIIDVDKGQCRVKSIALPRAKSGDVLFDLDQVQAEKQRERDVKEFADSLEEVSFKDVDIEQMVRQMGEKQNIEPNVLAIALQKIQEAKDVLR
jgi:exonuclease SbcD